MSTTAEVPPAAAATDTNAAPGASSQGGTTVLPQAEKFADKAASVLGPLLVLGIVAAIWIANAIGVGEPKLEVVTWAVRSDSVAAWIVSGRVIMSDDGRPVPGARVWAIAMDSLGNRFSPPGVLTNDAGDFAVSPIRHSLTGDTLLLTADVAVHATVRSARDTARTLRGEANLRLTRSGRVRWVEPSPFALVAIGLTFLLTLVIGLVNLRPTAIGQKRAKYYSLVLLSFIFTFSMVVLIALGLRAVNASASPSDVLSLGFANVYRGTYVKDLPAEWLFSLTSPWSGTQQAVASGFGVPLWLLLVAVLGSAIFTIAVLVKHVKDPIDFGNDTMFRERIEELVRHQFYMLFAPLGAVLVYQMMVAAGAASVQATVAITVFAAGAAVNLLLDKAVRLVQDLITVGRGGGISPQ